MTYALNLNNFGEWAMPAGASVGPAPGAWLATVYRLAALGQDDEAGMVIYDKMDELLFAGRFADANAVLKSVDLDRLSTLHQVAFLTITGGYRQWLPYRSTYFRDVEARVRAELPDRADRILVGLA